MINLPTEMLKELKEEGSRLPELILFHNLIEACEIAQKKGEGKLQFKVIDKKTIEVSGCFSYRHEIE